MLVAEIATAARTPSCGCGRVSVVLMRPVYRPGRTGPVIRVERLGRV
ncbi:hypothetical protein GCM10027261_24390 [Geodermatophilus arenarius]